jgi:hypothetical protein
VRRDAFYRETRNCVKTFLGTLKGSPGGMASPVCPVKTEVNGVVFRETLVLRLKAQAGIGWQRKVRAHPIRSRLPHIIRLHCGFFPELGCPTSG